MPTYLVESYWANHGDSLAEARERALRAAETAGDVRFVRTTFVPEDEVVLHIFEAPSAQALRDAAGRAALVYDRIVEAVEGPGERP